MSAQDLTLRKIALVIVGLEPHDADRLLAQLPAEQVAQVRRAVESLGDISREEQEAAIADFLASQARAEARRQASSESPPTDLPTNVSPLHDSAAVELDAGLARQFASAARGEESTTGRPTTARPSSVGPNDANAERLLESLTLGGEEERRSPHADSPWNRIQSLAPAQLAKCLSRENPQTVAAVMASLPSTQAAATLAALPETKQPDVLRRLSHARPLAADLLEDIAAGLLSSLAPIATPAAEVEQESAAVAAILAAADADQRRRWRSFVPELRRLADIPTPAADELAIDTDESSPATLPLDRTIRARRMETRSRPERNRTVEGGTRGGESRVSPRLRRTNGTTTGTRTTTRPPLRIAATPADEIESSQSLEQSSLERPSHEQTSAVASLAAPSPVSPFHSLGDLLELPEAELALLVANSDPWAVALAIAGATPELAAQWMRRMPTLDSREIQRQLTRLGPWRLADAEEAERQLVATAARLFHDHFPVRRERAD